MILCALLCILVCIAMSSVMVVPVVRQMPKFCIQVTKFLLPCQQGLVRVKYEGHY